MPPHLYASVNQLCPNHAHGGHFDVSVGALFSSSDLLHVYTVVHPKMEPGTPFLKGNHYLCLRNPCQPKMRLVIESPDKDVFLNEFVWVLGKWEF